MIYKKIKNATKSVANVKKSLTLHANKILEYDNTIKSQEFSLFS